MPINPSMPIIYYVLQGCKNENEDTFFEKIFVHTNPIEAREKAFLFYDFYVESLVRLGLLKTSFKKGLSCNFPIKEKTTFRETNFSNEDSLLTLTTKNITYTEPEKFDKGVKLFLVVKTTVNSYKLNEKRYLIHGIWNYNWDDLNEIECGILKEYASYKSLGYEVKNYVTAHELLNVQKKHYTCHVLDTPINLKNNSYLNSNTLQKNLPIAFIEDHMQTIQTSSLSAVDFQESFDTETFTIQLTSFLNKNGGYLYYGINKKRNTTNLFNQLSPEEFKFLTYSVIKNLFKAQSHLIKLFFIEIDHTLVAVFLIQPSPQVIYVNTGNYYILYDRNEKGNTIIVVKEQLADQGVVIDKTTYEFSRANPNAKDYHRRNKRWNFSFEKMQNGHSNIMY